MSLKLSGTLFAKSMVRFDKSCLSFGMPIVSGLQLQICGVREKPDKERKKFKPGQSVLHVINCLVTMGLLTDPNSKQRTQLAVLVTR